MLGKIMTAYDRYVSKIFNTTGSDCLVAKREMRNYVKDYFEKKLNGSSKVKARKFA